MQLATRSILRAWCTTLTWLGLALDVSASEYWAQVIGSPTIEFVQSCRQTTDGGYMLTGFGEVRGL